MKKEKMNNWITGIALLLMINLLGYYLISTIGENNNLADKWREVVAFENDCPKNKVVLIQYNGVRHNLFCLTQKEITDFLSRADAEELLNWFRR